MAWIITAFQAVSLTFALAAVATGLQAILLPESFARSFGIPIEQTGPVKGRKSRLSIGSPDPPVKAYVALMGVRQLATGLILWTFAYQRDWHAMATYLSLLGFVVAGTDGIYLSRLASIGTGLFHALPGAMIAILSLAYLYVER